MPTFDTGDFLLLDVTDLTKIVSFDLSPLTTGTQRTLTVPDYSGTLGMINASQTWTGGNVFTNFSVTNGTWFTSIVSGTLTAARFLTTPDLSGVIAVTNAAQSWSGNQTNMTLVTPALGTPASGTLTNCTGYTFANLASKPTTIAGYGITDFNSLGDARWARLSVTNTFTASQEIDGSSGSGASALVLRDTDSSHNLTIPIPALSTADRTIGFPDKNGTVALVNAAQSWSGNQSTMTLVTPTIADHTNAQHNHQNAAGGGALDAAAVTTGVLTADRVWQSVVKLTADVTTTSATAGNVTGLALALAASTYYEFEFLIPWKTSSTTDAIVLSLGGPASPTVLSYEITTVDNSGTGLVGFGGATYGGTLTTPGGTSTTTSNQFARIKGIVVNGANAGNLQVKFANNLGSATITVRQGATGKLTKLP